MKTPPYMKTPPHMKTPPPGTSGTMLNNKPKTGSGKRGRPKGSLNKKGTKKQQSTLLDIVRKNMNGSSSSGIKAFTMTSPNSILTSQKKKKQPYIVRQLVIMRRNIGDQPK